MYYIYIASGPTLNSNTPDVNKHGYLVNMLTIYKLIIYELVRISLMTWDFFVYPMNVHLLLYQK